MKGRSIIPSASLLLALFLIPGLASTQQRYQRWAGGVDDETLHFGFSFHYVSADLKMELAPNWQSTSGYRAIRSPFSNDVGIGLLADLKLSENLNLRFTPSLKFLNLSIQTTGPSNDSTFSHEIHRSDIELPLLVKFKSDRKANLRGYLIAGGQIGANVAPAKRYKPQEQLMTDRWYTSYTAGIGFDIYFDFFKMSPEIRWVQSIGNLYSRHPEHTYNASLPISRLFIRSLQFSLFFE